MSTVPILPDAEFGLDDYWEATQSDLTYIFDPSYTLEASLTTEK